MKLLQKIREPTQQYIDATYGPHGVETPQRSSTASTAPAQPHAEPLATPDAPVQPPPRRDSPPPAGLAAPTAGHGVQTSRPASPSRSRQSHTTEHAENQAKLQGDRLDKDGVLHFTVVLPGEPPQILVAEATGVHRTALLALADHELADFVQRTVALVHHDTRAHNFEQVTLHWIGLDGALSRASVKVQSGETYFLGGEPCARIPGRSQTYTEALEDIFKPYATRHKNGGFKLSAKHAADTGSATASAEEIGDVKLTAKRAARASSPAASSEEASASQPGAAVHQDLADEAVTKADQDAA